MTFNQNKIRIDQAKISTWWGFSSSSWNEFIHNELLFLEKTVHICVKPTKIVLDIFNNFLICLHT